MRGNSGCRVRLLILLMAKSCRKGNVRGRQPEKLSIAERVLCFSLGCFVGFFKLRKSSGSFTAPVVFKSGKLAGWGDEFYKNKKEIDVNIYNK